MHFSETPIPGALVIEPERRVDERGFFARVWCDQEFAKHGLDTTMRQTNMGVSRHAGTLRGLHFQHAPHAENKLIRCPRGAVYDVIVDLRAESRTFGRWYGVELTAANHCALYVPAGCAQGYITLMDDTEICYSTSERHAPGAAAGVRWDDPAFGIEWPMQPRVISESDRHWPDFISVAPVGVVA